MFTVVITATEGRVTGIGETMLREISQRLNFSYHLQELPPDGFWGELINGSWVGMLGQVVRQEKDFLINGMALVLDRSEDKEERSVRKWETQPAAEESVKEGPQHGKKHSADEPLVEAGADNDVTHAGAELTVGSEDRLSRRQKRVLHWMTDYVINI
ncbi:hypothetical protein O3P69_006241 [Scylla paramamosain]|uniref:Ionotropic glutamate receptor L-glutamate and glycine-binding domain-containing protein n=1 Tax=Scylla paramamosain TaxID=85552 RepID=A0AAW0U865_SCYPA